MLMKISIWAVVLGMNIEIDLDLSMNIFFDLIIPFSISIWLPISVWNELLFLLASVKI